MKRKEWSRESLVDGTEERRKARRFVFTALSVLLGLGSSSTLKGASLKKPLISETVPARTDLASPSDWERGEGWGTRISAPMPMEFGAMESGTCGIQMSQGTPLTRTLFRDSFDFGPREGTYGSVAATHLIDDSGSEFGKRTVIVSGGQLRLDGGTPGHLEYTHKAQPYAGRVGIHYGLNSLIDVDFSEANGFEFTLDAVEVVTGTDWVIEAKVVADGVSYTKTLEARPTGERRHSMTLPFRNFRSNGKAPTRDQLEHVSHFSLSFGRVASSPGRGRLLLRNWRVVGEQAEHPRQMVRGWGLPDAYRRSLKSTTSLVVGMRR